jgi:predicted ATP-grasp superfamily ATP-dependent carboligase
MADRRPAALILGLGYGGLNAVRSLARLGVAVHGVHRNAETPAAKSRFLSGLHVWDLATAPPEETLSWLCRLAEDLHQPVCIALDDVEAVFLARYREPLAPVLRYPFVSHELIERLVDKARLHELCRENGAPTPISVRATSRDGARAFGREVGYPLAVKGEKTFDRHPLAAVTIVRSERELVDLLERSEGRRPPAVLQEHLPNRRFCNWIFHAYFDERAECRFGMTAVKLLQNPHDGGRTVVAASIPNPILARGATELFNRIGYRGIVDCDYRYDPRDGTYKLLDANPRVGANFRTSVDTAGTDVVRSLYCDLAGLRAPAGAVRVGRRWLKRRTSRLRGAISARAR